MYYSRRTLTAFACLAFLLSGCTARTQTAQAQTVVIEAATPTQQHGSTGEDKKAGSAYGHVLGLDWGGHAGDYAEYHFTEAAPVSPALLTLRYGRQIAGTSRIEVTLDGRPAGTAHIASTGGWGDTASQFATVSVALPPLSAGLHTLRLTVPAPAPPRPPGAGSSAAPAPSPRTGSRRQPDR